MIDPAAGINALMHRLMAIERVGFKPRHRTRHGQQHGSRQARVAAMQMELVEMLGDDIHLYGRPADLPLRC
jgi:hypothetical protein